MTTIQSEDRGAVRVLTIDNLRRRNALAGDMPARLHEELLRADADPGVRCIVLTGAGQDAFCSGHDLHEVLADPESAIDPVNNAAMTDPPELMTPVIAAVNGPAFAGGFMLAMNCDAIIAGDNAALCPVGARIGLVPVGGQLSRLLDHVPYAAAFQMLATATPVGAEQAREWGLVLEVCDPAETVDRAVALAQVIAESSPSAVMAVKSGLRVARTSSREVALRHELALAQHVNALPDADEGVAAFLEKRPAVYPDAPEGLAEHIRGLEESR